MILISVLCALALDRLFTSTSQWELAKYAQWYKDKLSVQGYFNNDTSKLAIWALLLLPALLLGVVESLLPGFFVFILQTLVLYLCLGNTDARNAFKQYMAAANRHDTEACSNLLTRLTQTRETLPVSNVQELGAHTGLQLVWINYQYYIGVILWFTAFGAPGALFYCLTREMLNNNPTASGGVYEYIAKLMYALDFIPVRVAAFGMLVVGDFSRALPVWLNHLTTIEISAPRLLAEVALVSEPEVANESGLQQNPLYLIPRKLVNLAKRNLILVITFVALLTVLDAIS